jgi:hypothetical protein
MKSGSYWTCLSLAAACLSSGLTGSVRRIGQGNCWFLHIFSNKWSFSQGELCFGWIVIAMTSSAVLFLCVQCSLGAHPACTYLWGRKRLQHTCTTHGDVDNENECLRGVCHLHKRVSWFEALTMLRGIWSLIWLMTLVGPDTIQSLDEYVTFTPTDGISISMRHFLNDILFIHTQGMEWSCTHGTLEY